MSRESALKKSLRLNKKRLARARARARHTARVIAQARAKVILRRKQLSRLKKPEGAKASVKWALSQVGTVERPAFSNRGPKVSAWQRNFGMDGQPWCGAFVGTALKAAGLKPSNRIVYCPYIVEDAKRRRGGYKGFYAWSQRQEGDLVLFRFPGSSATADHVGIYIGNGKTVEGNTSPGAGGNQSNGGGTYVRTRPSSTIVGVARPRY